MLTKKNSAKFKIVMISGKYTAEKAPLTIFVKIYGNFSIISRSLLLYNKNIL